MELDITGFLNSLPISKYQRKILDDVLILKPIQTPIPSINRDKPHTEIVKAIIFLNEAGFQVVPNKAANMPHEVSHKGDSNDFNATIK
jgi:hypothetical protein